MYLDILNYDMVGFSNITAWEMMDHLFMTYGNITAVDLENYYEQMRRPWDPQQPVESHFKQMQDYADWNENPTVEKTWAQFKTHFAAAHREHKYMQGESAATSGYHATNADVGQTKYQIAESTIVALANLATSTAAARGVVATLTEENARMSKHLEDNSNELRELKALLKKERTERRGQHSFNPSPNNYC
jgi:hypothetical protein